MSVYQQTVNVFGQVGYPADPQVVIPFEPAEISIFNEDAAFADDAFISFDGVNDAGRVVGGSSLNYVQRMRRVWLRRGVIGAPPTNIQVIAEV